MRMNVEDFAKRKKQIIKLKCMVFVSERMYAMNGQRKTASADIMKDHEAKNNVVTHLVSFKLYLISL